jgi:hypothetical protein
MAASQRQSVLEGARHRLRATAADARASWAATPADVRRLLVVTTVVLVGFLAALGHHYITGVYLHLKYPATTFLFYPSDRFTDLYKDLAYARDFLAGKKTVITYTPVSHLLMTILQPLPRQGVFSFMVTLLLAALALASRWVMAGMTSLTATIKARSAFVLIALSYPILFVVDRANQEAFLFLFLLGFVYFYCHKGSRLGLVFLAGAISFKLFPVVLLMIPMADRRWRDAAYTALAAVGLLLGAAVVLGAWSPYGVGGVLQHWVATLTQGHGSSMFGMELLHFQHSLWGLFVLYGVLNETGVEAIRAFAGPYAASMIVLGGLVAAYVVFVEKEMWRRLALAVLAMITFPYASHDYTLLHVLLPVFLFVLSGHPRKSDVYYAVLFGLLLVPLDYYIFTFDVSSSVVAYPAIACTIMVSLIAGGFRRRFGHSRTGATAEARVAA